jgi:hypothetical protein
VVNQEKANQRTKVLANHQRKGKRLIPPLMQLTGLEETSWVKLILPELIWIALLNEFHGLKCGTELALRLPQETINVCEDTIGNTWFAPISSYGCLSTNQQIEVLERLKSQSILGDYQIALSVLVVHYPECPLNFLFTDSAQHHSKHGDLSNYKLLLCKLMDKRSSEATFTQAITVYISVVTDFLQVSNDTILAKLPLIHEYPGTEISKQIASSIRATMNVLFGSDLFGSDSTWPNYFWNRGLELEPCVTDNENE